MFEHSLAISGVPFFLAGSAGELFAIYYSPMESAVDKGSVIYVHPFAEEMNQARSVVAFHARELAKLGFGVLLLTMYGCGDSAGSFRDARWEIWKKDLAIAAQWLQEQGREPINLWGLRLGSLLALELASAMPVRYEKILLCQPVLSGEKFLTQFLRQRLTAIGAAGSRRKEKTTQHLRQRLLSGEILEVAGYELAPELALSIDRLHVPCLDSFAANPIYWIEIISEARSSIPRSRQQIIELWQKKGAKIKTYPVVAEPFWIVSHGKINLELLATMKQIFNESGI